MKLYFSKSMVLMKAEFLRRMISAPVRSAVPDRASRLRFAVGPRLTSNVVEEIGASPVKAVARSGAGYTYSVCIDIHANDVRCMEIAKDYVVSCMAATANIGKTAMAEAAGMARSRLGQLVSPERIDALSYLVAHDTVGYGPISMLMEDRQGIEEIEVNSPDSWITIYSARYGRCLTNLRFVSEYAFRSTINRMVEDVDKELNESTPIVDAQVEDLRIHAQVRPYAVSGAAASIRIGGRKEITLEYMLRNGTVTPQALAYIWIALESKHNMIISGAPASGKTTALGALMAFVPANEKVVTVEEDVNEVRTAGVNSVIALYGSRYNSVTPKEQVINALRLRPSRIVVGEMRGEEARDLFMGANIGIAFAATMHSNEGGMQILKKLLVKPMGVETRSLSTLDVALYMKQVDISKRIVSGISEYRWLSRAEIEKGEDVCGEDMVSVLEVMEGSGMSVAALQESKVMATYAKMHGITQKAALKEMDRRARLVQSALDAKGSGRSLEEEISRYGGW